MHKLQIPTGESRIFGVFGSGEKLVFVDNGSQNSSPYDVQVIDGCDTSDPNDRKGPKEPKDKYRISRSETPTYGYVPTGVKTQGVGLNRGRIQFTVRNSVASLEDDPVTGTVANAEEMRMIFE